MASPAESKDTFVRLKGFNLIGGTHDPAEVDAICNYEIRDSDVFVVTYPKSGTIWMQQILRLIEAKGDVNSEELNFDQVPWIELIGKGKEFEAAQSPRMRVTHLPYHLMPRTLSQKRGKDLLTAVRRICSFLGKELTDTQLADVVTHSTFKNMRLIPQANYEMVSDDLLNHHNGTFMRKGTIGDWKNHFTVAQNEVFDQVFQKEMKNFP
ncbi:hypothetical protein CRUP_021384, partial [Coryphaenoides rupestris]